MSPPPGARGEARIREDVRDIENASLGGDPPDAALPEIHGREGQVGTGLLVRDGPHREPPRRLVSDPEGYERSAGNLGRRASDGAQRLALVER